jgi:hypothetical protein
MSTLLTSASYDELALAERLHSDWIKQTTLHCFDDPGYVPTAIDPLKNRPISNAAISDLYTRKLQKDGIIKPNGAP